MRKLIILILTILAFSGSILARGYASGRYSDRGYKRSRNYRNQRWQNNPYGWGNRNTWRSNYWNSYYQPFPLVDLVWPYDEYNYSYDGYYDYNYCYPNRCGFGFFVGY